MKINTSQIEGYAEMTADEKIAALEAYEMNAGTDTISKSMYDKLASQFAEAKRQLKSKQTDEENAAAEQAQAMKDLQDQIAALQHEKAVSESKSKYLAMGYSDELAQKTAEAIANGDMSAVLANQKQFLAEYAKTIRAENMKMEPPAGGDGGEDKKKETDGVTTLIDSYKQSAQAAANALNYYIGGNKA